MCTQCTRETPTSNYVMICLLNQRKCELKKSSTHHTASSTATVLVEKGLCYSDRANPNVGSGKTLKLISVLEDCQRKGSGHEFFKFWQALSQVANFVILNRGAK